MADRSDDLRKQLEEAARAVVDTQLDHPSQPKDRILLNELSKVTSNAPCAGSTFGRRQTDEELIQAVMNHHGFTREEAIEELKLSGGL
jgi:hypothetical protein